MCLFLPHKNENVRQNNNKKTTTIHLADLIPLNGV